MFIWKIKWNILYNLHQLESKPTDHGRDKPTLLTPIYLGNKCHIKFFLAIPAHEKYIRTTIRIKVYSSIKNTLPNSRIRMSNRSITVLNSEPLNMCSMFLNPNLVGNYKVVLLTSLWVSEPCKCWCKNYSGNWYFIKYHFVCHVGQGTTRTRIRTSSWLLDPR